MKKSFKLGFNIFLYLSILFLAYYLYKQDYLFIPKEFDWGLMVFSLVLLFIGFFFNSIQWVPLLKSQGIKISYFHSVRTFGMAVFGKYIPGKVWVHLGKAAQISHVYGMPITKVSEVSFFSQIITLWVGALASLILLISLDQYDIVFWSFLCFFILTGLVISTKGMQKIGSLIIKRLLKKNFVFSSLNPAHFLKVLPLYFFTILSYSLGFLFFIKALGVSDLGYQAMFVFPAAMTIGVVAIIVPGGLGVREAVISTFLVSLAVPAEIAGTIAVASRLWFLFGEVFVFLLGFSFQRIWKHNRYPKQEV